MFLPCTAPYEKYPPTNKRLLSAQSPLNTECTSQTLPPPHTHTLQSQHAVQYFSHFTVCLGWTCIVGVCHAGNLSRLSTPARPCPCGLDHGPTVIQLPCSTCTCLLSSWLTDRTAVLQGGPPSTSALYACL